MIFLPITILFFIFSHFMSVYLTDMLVLIQKRLFYVILFIINSYINYFHPIILIILFRINTMLYIQKAKP